MEKCRIRRLGRSSSFIRNVRRSCRRGVLANMAVDACRESTGPASFTENYFSRFLAKYTRNGHRQKCIWKPELYTPANGQGGDVSSRHWRNCSLPKSLVLHRFSNPPSAHLKPFGHCIPLMISWILVLYSSFIFFHSWTSGDQISYPFGSNSPQYSSAATSGRCCMNFTFSHTQCENFEWTTATFAMSVEAIRHQ